MKKLLTIMLFISFIVSPFLAEEKERRPMTTDDVLNMASVGNALLSPDGQWVFYSESELDWPKNNRKTKYYMMSSEGGEPFQYIGEAGGSSFQFSPDGKFFTFKRTVEKFSQIFLMHTSGGEAVQLTKHKNSVGSYKWSVNSATIYFSASEPKSKEDEKKKTDGYDMIFVDEGPNGQSEGSWSNLWMFDLETKSETKITDEEFLLGNFDVSADGKKVIFTARYSNRRNDQYKSEIYLMDFEKKEKIRLTDNNSPEGGLMWAPNGENFIFSAANDKEWLNRNSKIYLMNPESKDYRLVSEKFEGSPRVVAWTDDSRYLFLSGQQKSDSNFYKMDITTGDYTNITQVSGSLRVSSISKDKTKVLYSFSDYKTPSDIYVSHVDNFEPKRLTNANPWIETDILLADMKVIQWPSKNGFEIEGLLHLPPGVSKDTKPPLIVNIHGGPAGSFTNSFRASYHVYAGLGYASLSPNVRGSSGYTDKLREGNTFQKNDGIGLGDFHDVMNGVDYVIDEEFIDADHIGIKGWSYGGILGGWTITQTDRFKAASLGAGVYDWASEYGPGFNYDVRLWHIGGTPWDNPEGYRKQSTLTYVNNITTPTLIIHGMRDTTDTESQSMSLFAAIKDIGKVPVRYLRAPREPHGFREARHQRTRDIEEIKWMQKYILDIDWTPWERAEEKKEEKEEEKK
ncbi:prolyl oligopeptidase family serine peptidase [Acidobacteriota bacterium]